MTVLYMDASAFLKVYVEEPQSRSLRRFLRRRPRPWVSSAILRVEATRSLRRSSEELIDEIHDALRRTRLVPVDDAVLSLAADVEPAALRTLDAIHLATALVLGSDLDAVVTYDRRMATAAESLGLRTVAPS